MRHLIFLALTISAFISEVYGQDKPSLTPSRLRILDSIATQDVPPGAPGIATGIVINGQIAYRKCAGYADLKDSLLIDENSRFNIASNAKQFTALAILLLEASHKLNLDDDIRKFFPQLYGETKFKITIQDLLNHSSGIRDVYDLWALQGITWWKTTFNNQDALRLLQKQTELNFEPGTQYLYSNSNYILLALIVEKAAQKPFVEFTRSMFSVLGMTNTSFVNDHRKIQGPVAKPYFNFDKWLNYKWQCDIYGDGNLFSTLKDQLQWEKIVQAKQAAGMPAGIIEKSQQLTANSSITNYGYGLEFGEFKALPYKFHEGSTGAWKATVVRFPVDNLSIVTLTNSGKTIPAMQTRQMAELLTGSKTKENKHLIQPEHIGDFVSVKEILGVYTDDHDFSFRFVQKDSSLYLIRFGRNDIRLIRESANVFHQQNDPAFKQEFKKNANGNMQVTAYYTTHAPYTLNKVEHNWDGFGYKKLNGWYINDETDTRVEIKHLAMQTYAVKIGKNKMTGILITPEKLLCDDYSIGFANEDAVPTLFLNSNRIKKVRFYRAK